MPDADWTPGGAARQRRFRSRPRQQGAGPPARARGGMLPMTWDGSVRVNNK